MNMVRMVTTAPHVYAGRRLAIGDEFDCEPPHVIVMETLGRARKKDEAPQPAQQYQTRDMTAARPARGRRRQTKAAT